jgi:hypothetical protein
LFGAKKKSRAPCPHKKKNNNPKTLPTHTKSPFHIFLFSFPRFLFWGKF